MAIGVVPTYDWRGCSGPGLVPFFHLCNLESFGCVNADGREHGGHTQSPRHVHRREGRSTRAQRAAGSFVRLSGKVSTNLGRNHAYARSGMPCVTQDRVGIPIGKIGKLFKLEERAAVICPTLERRADIGHDKLFGAPTLPTANTRGSAGKGERTFRT